MILSGAMLLEHIGEVEASRRVRAAVARVISEGKVVTYDLGGAAATQEMADAVIASMQKAAVTR
jgi:isocitrate/isopropylmalate dehydrogenase